MTTLAEHIIVAGAENRPLMLEKLMYDSWVSRICLFIKGKKHGRMMLDSIDNGPLVYPTVEENGQTRPKKYSELTKVQQLQDDCDVQATNIIFTVFHPMQKGDYYGFLGEEKEVWNVRKGFDTLEDEVVGRRALTDGFKEYKEGLKYLSSRFPPSNNQLRTLSNPRNQATIQDGRVIVQQVKGRQNQSYASIGNRGIATTSKGNIAAGPPRITIPQNSDFQTDDLDAYDSDCDDVSSAKAVLMANLLSCDPEVLSEDTNPSAPNDLLVLSLVEQMTNHVAHLDKENRTNKIIDESLTAELERYKERITIFKQRLNVDLNTRKKLIDSQMDDLIRDRNAKLAAFQQEIDTLKETLSNNVKEKESLSKTLIVFKTESKEKKSKYIDKEIVLEKQNKELENIIYDTHRQALGYQNPFNLKKAQRIQPTLYDGSVIAKEHAVISMIDDEEILILEEKSRSKILDKQNDPISIERKIKISPIDYSKLNKIKEDFGKCFDTKKELSTEQAFWLKHSSLSETPVMSHTPVRIEAPKF
ncbi:hypothetical protein Tco_0183973 [Tanacetum coccineum]